MRSDHLKIRKKKRKTNPVIVSVFLTAVAAFLISAAWQLSSPPIEEKEAFQFDPSVLSPQEGTESELSESSSLSSESVPEEKESSSISDSSKEEYGVPVSEQPDRVTSAYFDDAVFIGDSITTGISLYDVMSNTTVYASTGVGLSNVLTKEFASVGGTDMTVPDALRAAPPKKIYLLLGANSLAGDLDEVAKSYASVLDTIRSCAPDALLYVQSVFPINEELYAVKYNGSITNEIIREFNQKLLKICEEKKIYYLDLYSFFADESGQMPSEYTPDGLHFNSAQYLDWFDYLKTHAIEK